ncbi:hypothetical protein BDV41DRAFT_533430 [Aspergillus transmontanensis]|uniref:Uncharacterized protein n=1 Tax=Aspergillus transmontanensis TaxID=1034304 RepID=A0A5N6W1K6_9EURO|nr:hypothetical protein BDV41DRAFT_533430 [Aspergillus transmontanensis]
MRPLYRHLGFRNRSLPCVSYYFVISLQPGSIRPLLCRCGFRKVARKFAGRLTADVKSQQRSSQLSGEALTPRKLMYCSALTVSLEIHSGSSGGLTEEISAGRKRSRIDNDVYYAA